MNKMYEDDFNFEATIFLRFKTSHFSDFLLFHVLSYVPRSTRDECFSVYDQSIFNMKLSLTVIWIYYREKKLKQINFNNVSTVN